ncbi:MAG TPA: hypothetical protein VFM18_09915, partial [Methanosarcina sp.]|nr:hypothetical protein [Methanosarcina sp.]
MYFIANQLIEFATLKYFKLGYQSLCRWDCGWYSTIVDHGYDYRASAHPNLDAANWAFFPAFPFTSKLLQELSGLTTPLSLIVTSKILFFLSLWFFVSLKDSYKPKVSTHTALAVAALNPYSIYGNVGYSESFFLLFSCIFFIKLKENNIILSATAAALLSAIRPVGFAALVSYTAATYTKFKIADSTTRRRILIGILICPLGLSFFMIYLHYLTGDALAFSHVQRAWARIPESPFKRILNGLNGDQINCYWSILSTISLICCLYLYKSRQIPLFLFSLICTITPLSTGLWAMPRYIFWQAPILLTVSEVLAENKIIRIFFITAGIAGYIYMTIAWS